VKLPRATRLYVRINGEMRYLWRAVDHEGEVLESFVTKDRDKAAALRFIRKAMKRHGRPKAIVTDKLRSYGAALKEIGNADRQETGRHLNNRAENSGIMAQTPLENPHVGVLRHLSWANGTSTHCSGTDRKAA
jgi:transposase-like protein